MFVRRFQSIERVARRKLLYLNQAVRLEDLREAPVDDNGDDLRLIGADGVGVELGSSWLE